MNLFLPIELVLEYIKNFGDYKRKGMQNCTAFSPTLYLVLAPSVKLPAVNVDIPDKDLINKGQAKGQRKKVRSSEYYIHVQVLVHIQ